MCFNRKPNSKWKTPAYHNGNLITLLRSLKNAEDICFLKFRFDIIFLYFQSICEKYYSFLMAIILKYVSLNKDRAEHIFLYHKMKMCLEYSGFPFPC